MEPEITMLDYAQQTVHNTLVDLSPLLFSRVGAEYKISKIHIVELNVFNHINELKTRNQD